MGIMITYGSYVKNDIDLNKATNQIEIFDTGVAILAGMMIIPAVFVFLGKDGMASGPSQIFISLPKVFDAMGVFGRPAAIAFFLMMGFAAYSRAVSAVIRFSLYRVNRPESIETISFPTEEEIIPSDCGILLWS